jgi:hypothetical protein
MTIKDVMQATSKQYEASWFPFEQAALLHQGNDRLPLNNGRGVCGALCRIWLHHGHGRLVPSRMFAAKMEEKILDVVAKQQRLKDARQSAALKKMEPQWSTPKIVDYGPNGPTTPFMTWREAIRIQQATMQFRDRAYDTPSKFWAECVDGMTHFHSGKNYVTLNWQAKDFAHAVALRENGGTYYFFDPNGGILRFKDPRRMKAWLLTEYPTANGFTLEGLTVEVYDYKPKADRARAQAHG